MEFDQVVLQRRMCRDFADAPISTQVLDEVFRHGLRAPSAGNTRGTELLVLEGREQTAKFWSHDADPAWLAAPDHPGLLLAPVIVLPLACRTAYIDRYSEADKTRPRPVGWSAGSDPTQWLTPYWLVDAAFVAMSVLLSAEDHGLGALFFRLHLDPSPLLEALGVPDDYDPIGALALGRPAQALSRGPARRSSPRRAMKAERVHHGRW